MSRIGNWTTRYEITQQLESGGGVKKRKQKPIAFSMKGFEKLPRKTQLAILEMIKCAYKMIQENPSLAQIKPEKK